MKNIKKYSKEIELSEQFLLYVLENFHFQEAKNCHKNETDKKICVKYFTLLH